MEKDRKIHMPNSNELPVKCQECAKSKANMIQNKCGFCIHLYVESDGTHSVDTMIREIKRFSNNAILSNPGIKSKLDEGSEIWDLAYFSQTVG